MAKPIDDSRVQKLESRTNLTNSQLNNTNSQFQNKRTLAGSEIKGLDINEIIKPEEWYNIPHCVKSAIERLIELQQMSTRTQSVQEKRINDGFKKLQDQ